MVMSRAHAPLFEGWRDRLPAIVGDESHTAQGHLTLAARDHGMALQDLGARHNYVGRLMARHENVKHALEHASIINLTGDVGESQRLDLALKIDAAYATLD